MNFLASQLVHAVQTRTALDPGSTNLTPEEAYEIQDEVIEALGGSAPVAKLGLTSKAKQQQMKVAEPLYGWFVEGSEIRAGESLVSSELIQPRVEPEVAFLIGDDLAGPDVGAHQVLAATVSVMPAIDVLDSRYSGYSFTLPDVIADNASAAHYALGGPVPVEGINLRNVGCVFSKNGEVVGTAAGAAVMGHPAAAVAWFVRKLSERNQSLAAGSLVLAGALTGAIPVAAGDSVTVEIDRIGALDLAVR